MDTALDAAFAASGLAGAAVSIVGPEGVRYARGFGEAVVGSGRAMTVDTPAQIASMTKALVSVGAMQLVEAGRLSLDEPIGGLLPDLADPQVLAGFDGAGKPQLRAAKTPITLRHLLTHTSGLGYFFISGDLQRYFGQVGTPAPGSLDSIRLPLLFDPGERWEYGVSTDWVGQAIEKATGERLGAYLEEHLFAPLGMGATGFFDAIPEGAASVHVRKPEGGLAASPIYLGGGEFDQGGGGAVSTAADYARFVTMLVRGGELEGKRVLKAETVAEMAKNQVAPLRAGYMGSAMPEFAPPYDTFPDQHTGWGLGFLINPEPGPAGRAPGSCAWAGIFNSYYWFDPANQVGGVFVSQLQPFGDPGALTMFAELEKLAYA